MCYIECTLYACMCVHGELPLCEHVTALYTHTSASGQVCGRVTVQQEVWGGVVASEGRSTVKHF